MTSGMKRICKKSAVFQQCVWFLIIFILLLLISSESVSGFSIGAKIQQSAGCYHNGTIYAERSLIPSVEPCLTCRCQNKSLVCALKVCPEQVSIPPRGCVLIQPKRACCPYLSCKTFRVNSQHNEIITRRLDQIGYGHYEVGLDNDYTENANNNILQRSDDIALFEENSVCIEDGSIYGSGSAMISSNFCSYCYCFAGKRICVNPKCQLPNSKCRPLYTEGSCCPVHYDCSGNSTTTPIKNNSNSLIPSNSIHNRNYLRKTKLPENKGKCYTKGASYFDGQKLPTDKNRPCEMCFCIRGNVMCTPKKCAPYIGNCKPLIPEGECCAVGYECRSKSNETTRHFRQDTAEEFDLFALLFGEEKPSATTTDTTPTKIEESTKINDNNNNQDESSVETSTAQILREKGFFELLRDGLSILENSDEEQNDTQIETSTISDDRLTTDNLNNFSDDDMQRVNLLMPSTKIPEVDEALSSTSILKDTPTSSSSKPEELSSTQAPNTMSSSTLKSTTTVHTTTKPRLTTTRITKQNSTKKIETSRVEDKSTMSTTQNQDDQTEIIGTEIYINTETSVPDLKSSVTSTSTTTTPPVMTTMSIMPFKPLNYGNSSNFFSAFLNMFDLGKITSTTKAPVIRVSSPIPNDVKINPLIVEPQYNFDYDAPTLPPSLPNLRIIPFVPDDAVELRTEDLEKYPSITEQTSIDRYDDLEKINGQDLEQKKDSYNFDYDHVGEIPVQGGWSDYYTNYRPLSYDQKPSKNVLDRFSPPLQTEVGGFMPKEPIKTKTQFIESLYITTSEPIKSQTQYKEPTANKLLLANYNKFDQSMISITTNAIPSSTNIPVLSDTSHIEPTIRIEKVPIFKGIPATLQQLSRQPALDTAETINENRRKSEAMTEHILNEIGVIRVGAPPVQEKATDYIEKTTLKNGQPSTSIEHNKKLASNPGLGIESREANPEIHTKPLKLNDINNLLRLSGCNIYGQMYNVGEFIEELSSSCTICMCTNTGVQCNDTPCK